MSRLPDFLKVLEGIVKLSLPPPTKNVNRVSAVANPMPKHRGGANFEFFVFSWGFL
jgi:hypothetical protein